jgi:UDP:flavonoid glycosyltransferase YjiC (YdhE family)
MRILISAGPMYGHVNSVLPLAEAAQRAGHEVVLATGRISSRTSSAGA